MKPHLQVHRGSTNKHELRVRAELSRIQEGKVLEETYEGYKTSKERIEHSIRRYRRNYLHMSV